MKSKAESDTGRKNVWECWQYWCGRLEEGFAALRAAEKQQSCRKKTTEIPWDGFSAGISSCCQREQVFMCPLHHVWLLQWYNQHHKLITESMKEERREAPDGRGRRVSSEGRRRVNTESGRMEESTSTSKPNDWGLGKTLMIQRFFYAH